MQIITWAINTYFYTMLDLRASAISDARPSVNGEMEDFPVTTVHYPFDIPLWKEMSFSFRDPFKNFNKSNINNNVLKQIIKIITFYIQMALKQITQDTHTCGLCYCLWWYVERYKLHKMLSAYLSQNFKKFIAHCY